MNVYKTEQVSTTPRLIKNTHHHRGDHKSGEVIFKITQINSFDVQIERKSSQPVCKLNLMQNLHVFHSNRARNTPTLLEYVAASFRPITPVPS